VFAVTCAAYLNFCMGKYRLLLTDDSPAIRKCLSSLIAETEDMEIVGEGQDGHEAVDLTKCLRPDAIIMDVNMPNMDGIEATNRIHSEFPEILVIGFSLFEDPETAGKMLNAGAIRCLSKSMPWESFLSEIRQALSNAPVAA
jgi:DNA-binding NarL/FixJ family response regulator